MSKITPLIEIVKKSSIPLITIKYGREEYTINVRKELIVNSANINHEIMEHPKVYGFLGLVHSKLKAKVEILDARKKKVWAKSYLRYKSQIQNGRPISDDVAKAKVEVDKKYRQAIRMLLKYKAQLDEIGSVLESFKQKKELIQTLSSNIRNTS